MATPANRSLDYINGYDVTLDLSQCSYQHTVGSNPLLPDNVGVKQYSPGIFQPKLTINGIYAKRGIGAITAHNLLYPTGIGGTNDTVFQIMKLLGNNAAPVQGDCAVLFQGTLTNYQRPDPYAGIMTANATFEPRGLVEPLFPILVDINTAVKTATNVSSTPYDDGAESNGTLLGAVAALQIISPTGVAATGSITVPTQPVAADTVTVNGTVYTWRAALTPTAGEVLIGTTALASAQNLWAALTGGLGAGTTYATGTTSFSQLLLSATAFFSVPSGGSNTITITYATTGVAGNAFTLTKTGTGGLTVSGATLTAGVNGDTYNITVASSATSGGSYVTHATFSGVGATRTGQQIAIPAGITLNEWIKVTYTLASGAGTVQTFSAAVVFGRWWQL